MLKTFDLPEVQRFATDLAARRVGCGNADMYCSDLDRTLGCQVDTCLELVAEVNSWANAVFTGRIATDPEVEAVFKSEIKRAIDEAGPLAEHGREIKTECFDLERLADLEDILAYFAFVLKNWVTPQKSAAPAPRVTIGEDAAKQIRERIASLSPLPAGWRPTDPRQARLFGRRPSA